MIKYTDDLNVITEKMLCGFFVGWPSPPSAAMHLRILKGSYLVWLAIDTEKNIVVGFVNAVSDGILSAYIPLLEVLPEYQKSGIGRELVNRSLDSLKHLYMVDLLCDQKLQGYYEKLGMKKATGAFIRNYGRQAGE